jgi:hypothetical protein
MKLPLDSRNWIMLHDVHYLAVKAAGDIDFLVVELQAGLEDEKIHSKLRWKAASSRRTTQRLLSGEDWLKHYEVTHSAGFVGAKRRDPNLPDGVFFVWKPDIEKMFPSGWPTASQSQKFENISTPTAHKKRKSPKGHNWVAIRIEIMRRVVETLPEGPDNVAEVARGVRAWCLEKYGKQPAFSAMREEVSRIAEGLRALLN